MALRRSVPRALATWSPVIDQFLVGAASGFLLIAGSATMDPDEFGQFGFAYNAVAVAAVIWRGGFLARLSLIESHHDLLARLRRTLRLVIASSPLSVAPVGALVWVAGASGGLSPSTAAMCCSLPVVLVYEGLRQGLIAADDSPWPLASSTVWMVASAGGLAATFRLDSAMPALIVWLGVGAVGCVVLWLRLDALARRKAEVELASTEVVHTLPSIWHFNLVATLPALASLGVAWAALFAAGPAVMAQIVVLNAVLYPLSVYTQAVPLFARTLRSRGKSGSGLAVLGLVGGAALWFVAVTWAFPGLVARLFGESWTLASGLLWIATLNLLAGALVAIETAALHHREQSRVVRLVVLVVSPVRVGGAWFVASLTGSAGWIITLELILHTSMWLWLRRHSRIS